LKEKKQPVLDIMGFFKSAEKRVEKKPNGMTFNRTTTLKLIDQFMYNQSSVH